MHDVRRVLERRPPQTTRVRRRPEPQLVHDIRPRTAFDGPAACALAARATKAMSNWRARAIVASAVAQNARLSPTQTRLTHLAKKAKLPKLILRHREQ